MKKTFKLFHPKTKTARLVEAAKRDVRKYLKRERKKALPEGVDFWEFDCKFGHTSEVAKEVHWSGICKLIDEAEEQHLESFYVEILARPGFKIEKS